MDHPCYYCDQIFDSDEKLYAHLDVHADTKDNQEIKRKKKRE
jgi:hypothetical protein